ncbi:MULTISPECIES: nitroreductase family protein [unclassified Streptomyces]|uniref:nitroreductase family protein n=1 Tax=unclassified Streptomyces TaxID=2593676 RepID=UPI000A8B6F0B|nr:nitroreductase family protein [Streptomyces sp. CB02058]
MEVRAKPLWKRMAVDSAGGGRPPVLMPAAGLRTALAVLDLGMVGSDSSRRAVPSAGASYPYECYILTRDDAGTTGLHQVDPGRRHCQLLSCGPHVDEALCRAALALPEGGAVVVLATRPWLSMRKYGDRGYLYTQLDTAHLHMNLVLAADSLGASIVLRQRPPGLEPLVREYGECAEVHSALAVTAVPAGNGPDAEPSGWVVRDARTTRPASLRRQPHWLERLCWESLVTGSEGSAAGPVGAAISLPMAVRRRGRAPLVPRTAFHSRRSATGFAPGTVPARDVHATVGRAMSVFHDLLPLAGTPPHATLVMRQEKCERDRSAGPAGLGVRWIPELPDESVTEAFMAQRHLADTAAVLLLHAPTASLIEEAGGSQLWTVLYHAGALAQLVYLEAARCGLAVTGVGGFDSGRWQRLAGLPADHDVVYAVAMGVDTPDAPKLDRLAVAYAQNERS